MLRLSPPGDKSITHRALILSSLASGTSRLRGLLVARDTEATARALRALGAEIPPLSTRDVEIHGPAWLHAPDDVLECENSGTTARLLLGLLVGLGLAGRLNGDASLRRRPMERVVYPLQAMGAKITYLEEPGRLPLQVERRTSGSLRPLRHRLRIASAQVKSSLLLAGLAGRVRVEVEEPGRSRDHTERMLRAMGAPVSFSPRGPGAFAIFEPETWDGRLGALDLRIPGDPSAAAFLVVAAVLAGRSIRVEGVSLNHSRNGFLEVAQEMGLGVQVQETSRAAGEPCGEVSVESARLCSLRPFGVESDRVPRLVDEIPALAMLACRASGVSTIRGAAELRVKESDRLALLAQNLTRLGVPCRELPDGLEIEGTKSPLVGVVETGGDHRIAMAFGALGTQPENRIRLDDPECVSVSYPGFWKDLEGICQTGGGSRPPSEARPS